MSSSSSSSSSSWLMLLLFYLVVEEILVPLAQHLHAVLQREPESHRPLEFVGRHTGGRGLVGGEVTFTTEASTESLDGHIDAAVNMLPSLSLSLYSQWWRFYLLSGRFKTAATVVWVFWMSWEASSTSNPSSTGVTTQTWVSM